MISDFYQLGKPGIVYGNALTAAAGFFIGARGTTDFAVFFAMLFGISLIIAAGCVFNNVADRDIDALMKRTRTRALVRGSVSVRSALAYGAALLCLGSILLLCTNSTALSVGLAGFLVYTVVYTLWCKRNTLHASIIGAIAGAVPPVVGYAAASNSLDLAALILFFILFTWQMPHALAIAIRRIEDYRAASLPVMPIVLNPLAAKAQMLAYAAAFFLATIALWSSGFAGRFFAIGMGSLSLVWLYLCVLGFTAKDDQRWAKQVFLFSLVLLLAFCLFCALESILR